MFSTTTPRRFARPLLLACLLPLAHAGPAPASMLIFSDPNGTGLSGDSVNFFANGFLTGTLSLPVATLYTDTGVFIRSYDVYLSSVSFGLGGPVLHPDGTYTYEAGGSVLMTGGLNGGPDEVLLTGDRVFGAIASPGGPGGYYLSVAGRIRYDVLFPPDFLALFGQPEGAAYLSLNHCGLPGDPTSGAVRGQITMHVPSTSATPEPASAGLLGVGGMVVVGWVRWRARKRGGRGRGVVG